MVKKTLISFLFIGYCSLAIGQSLADSLRNKANIFYMKNSGKIVPNKDSADFVRVIMPPDITTFFVVKDYYMNGGLKLTGRSKTSHAYYTGQGTFYEYFPNGNRKSSYVYDNGKRVGNTNWYYPNGELYYISSYDKDKKLTYVYEAKDSAGTALAENGKGTWVEYTPNFKFVEGRGNIENGLKEGEWQGTPNDSLRYVCTYSKGVSISGTSYEKSGAEHNFTKDMVEPEYKGGIEKFYSFIAHTMHYPKSAKENNTQGKVFASFVVEKDGKLTNLEIIKGLSPDCDKEVLRVLALCKVWSPGHSYGIPVKVTYSLPFTFALQSD
jgi:TonB family protein